MWKARDDGRFYHFKTYPICNWSGNVGPKTTLGDKQAPEGFYRVANTQMNPNSQYYLAFNLGYPNAYDRALQRTGDALMVHGKCKSVGCYAMTDALIEEIYTLAREALKGGQESFEVHAFPFRMTEANMARYAGQCERSVLEDAEARLRLLREVPPAADGRRVREALRRQREDPVQRLGQARRPLPALPASGVRAVRAEAFRAADRRRAHHRAGTEDAPVRQRDADTRQARRRKRPTAPRTASALPWRRAARARRRSASRNNRASPSRAATMRPRRVVARAAKHRHGRLMVARRRSRWSAALMVFGALAAVAAGIGYFFWPQIYALIEEEMIYAAKARHWAAYSNGYAAAGYARPEEPASATRRPESSTRRTGFQCAFSNASSSWRCG